MAHDSFEACTTLNDHHLVMAGLVGREAEIVAGVRQAVGRREGAGWIDVEGGSWPANPPGWVILYPPGRAVAPDTVA
jgi:hypothetical protein